MRKLPDFSFEQEVWSKGFGYVAGIDEVGRGCFAGPIVASAVAFAQYSNFQLPIFNRNREKITINDSKKLSAKQREIAAIWIKKNALAWGIGEVSARTINKVGLTKATQMAYRRAIKEANQKLTEKSGSLIVNRESIKNIPTMNNRQSTIDYLLIDAFYIPLVKGLRRENQLAIIKGDSKSISIAAASIIAKVYRDHLMEKIGKWSRYKKYNWTNNKGYGTKKHLEAIEKNGTNGYHRKQFVETWRENCNMRNDQSVIPVDMGIQLTPDK